MKKNIVFSFLILVSALLLSVCEDISSNEEVVVEENLGESVTDDWSTFESAEVDVRMHYPSELTVEFTNQETAGFDVGKKRSYSFKGVVDGINVDFGITATTADFGVGIGEGCCFDYAGPALDLSQNDENILSDLESGYQNYKTEHGKFLEVYGLDRVQLGSHEAVLFSKPAGFVYYTLSEHFLIPNSLGDYSNLLISWRSSDQHFPSDPDDETVSVETLFDEVEAFAHQWMNELTESEEKEVEIIKDILSTIEFIELEPEDVEDTSDTLFTLFTGPAELDNLPFDASRSFNSGVIEDDSSYTILFSFNNEGKGRLVFYKEPITDPAEKIIPEESTLYQSYSSGVTTYCDEMNCVIVIDGLDDYYRLTIIDEGLSSMELELLKEYIKTIQVR